MQEKVERYKRPRQKSGPDNPHLTQAERESLRVGFGTREQRYRGAASSHAANDKYRVGLGEVLKCVKHSTKLVLDVSDVANRRDESDDRGWLFSLVFSTPTSND